MVIYTFIDEEPEIALTLWSLLGCSPTDVSEMSLEISMSNKSMHSTQCGSALCQT
jgi:hypothetical protein